MRLQTNVTLRFEYHNDSWGCGDCYGYNAEDKTGSVRCIVVVTVPYGHHPNLPKGGCRLVHPLLGRRDAVSRIGNSIKCII